MGKIRTLGKIYHAAVYVRLSKEDGDLDTAFKAESNSISNQKELIEYYLKDKKDIRVVSVRVDDGYTGSNFDRPAFRMMMEDIKNGIVDCVVVKDLSRFAREYIDCGRYLERTFPSMGVRFIAINDNYDSLNGKDQADEIIIPFKNLINDQYCRDISIKIRSQLEVKRKKGEYIGAFAPYGYQKSPEDYHKIVPDVCAAGVVQEIFRKKINGMSQDAIAKYLNGSGIPSPSEYKRQQGERYRSGFSADGKAKWSAVAVRRILENEFYIGNLVQGRRTTPNHKVKREVLRSEAEWIRIEKNHEPLVSDRDFEIVQKLLSLDMRTSPSQNEVYLLAGIAVCADCGMPMTRKKSRVGGKEYDYYMCSTYLTRKECSHHRVPVKRLEHAVFSVIRQQIRNVIDIKRLAGRIGSQPFRKLDIRKLEEQRGKKQAEMETYKERRIGLYEDLKDGILTKEDYLEFKSAYEKKEKETGEQLKRLEGELEVLLSEKDDRHRWMDYFIRYKDAPELTRSMVVELISSVRVKDKDNIEVIFDFDDYYRTIMQELDTAGIRASAEDGSRLNIAEVREVV